MTMMFPWSHDWDAEGRADNHRMEIENAWAEWDQEQADIEAERDLYNELYGDEVF